MGGGSSRERVRWENQGALFRVVVRELPDTGLEAAYVERKTSTSDGWEHHEKLGWVEEDTDAE